MKKLCTFVIIGFVFIQSNEQPIPVRPLQMPSSLAMQKDKENFYIDCLKTTYGYPANCRPGAVCCYVACCPCVALAGLVFTLKERNKS